MGSFSLQSHQPLRFQQVQCDTRVKEFQPKAATKLQLVRKSSHLMIQYLIDKQPGYLPCVKVWGGKEKY